MIVKSAEFGTKSNKMQMYAAKMKKQYPAARQLFTHLPRYSCSCSIDCLHNKNSRIKTFLLRQRLRERVLRMLPKFLADRMRWRMMLSFPNVTSKISEWRNSQRRAHCHFLPLLTESLSLFFGSHCEFLILDHSISFQSTYTGFTCLFSISTIHSPPKRAEQYHPLAFCAVTQTHWSNCTAMQYGPL